jgi:hypothetical protein
MERPGDHLVGPADLDQVVDAGEVVEIEADEACRIADEADDRVDGTARDERLAAGVADLLSDALDVGIGRLSFHHHDHGCLLGSAFRLLDPRGPRERSARETRNPGPSTRGPLRFLRLG